MTKNSIPAIRNVQFKALPIPTSQPGSSLLAPSNRGIPPRMGVRAVLQAYSQMPWLRSIAGKIGQGIAEIEWLTFTSERRGRPRRAKDIESAPAWRRTKLIAAERERGQLRELPDHPLRDLLRHGNARMSGDKVLGLTQTYIDLVGEAYLLVERDPLGTPAALWPVSPAEVVELPNTEFPFFRIVVGARQFDVPVTEVIVFHEPDPVDAYGRGTGIAHALGDELELDEHTTKHLKAFFQNRARPDLIISANHLSREDTKRLEEKWMQTHQGFWRAAKPHFFNRQIDVQEIGQDFESMQLRDLRSQQRDIILQVFNIPPEIVGHLQNSNRSTVVTAQEFWQRNVIQPRVESLRKTLQRQLVPQFDERLILDYESPVVEDREHQLNVMKTGRFAVTVNEWRAAAGLPTLGERGDVFIRQAQDLEVPVESGDSPDINMAAIADEITQKTIARVKQRLGK